MKPEKKGNTIITKLSFKIKVGGIYLFLRSENKKMRRK
jgi:hypothetical protein